MMSDLFVSVLGQVVPSSVLDSVDAEIVSYAASICEHHSVDSDGPLLPLLSPLLDDFIGASATETVAQLISAKKVFCFVFFLLCLLSVSLLVSVTKKGLFSF